MTEWIISYEVVEGASVAELNQAVAARIDEGWQPWSSPYAVGGGYHCQAMVRTQEGLTRFENERRRRGEAKGPTPAVP